MTRKFFYYFFAILLFVIALGATLATLVMTGTLGLGIYQKELADYAFVPDTKFEKQEALAKNIYDDPKMWFAMGRNAGPDNAVRFVPSGAPETTIPGQAAIFFIHPTSYMEKKQWNAPLDDQQSQARARLFLRGMASAFAPSGEIWAPRYRQAAIGAFLTTKPEGAQALDAAYQDVVQAFDAFVAKVQKDRPIILAGHSQGALHLTHLLKDKVAGKPIAKRVVAAYVVGWPVSTVTDLGAIGMPACTSPDQIRCLMSWESFAEPADYQAIVDLYDKTTGFDGNPRKDTPIVCTNPLNGGAAPDAPMTANLGTLVPSDDLVSGKIVPSAVPARCDERGFLLIGDPPNLGPYVLPGNNFHVYDYPLFWTNVRADALGRLQAYLARPRR
jgi:predicted DNA-binding protein (MmcQ/YjbR family)